MLTNRIDSEIRDRLQGITCHFEPFGVAQGGLREKSFLSDG